MKATTERGRDASERKHARYQRRGIAHHGGVPVSDRVVRARAEERETQRSKTTNDFEFAADGEAEQADVRGAEREGVLDAGEDETGAVSVAGRETGDGLELGVVSQLSERLSVLHVLPEELANLLRNRNTLWAKKFPDVPVPSLKTTLIFISTHGHSSSHTAALGTSLGFMRCSIVDGGLRAAFPLAHFDTPDASSPEKSISLSFDAVLLLLETVRDNGNALGLVILDLIDASTRGLYTESSRDRYTSPWIISRKL